MKLSAFRSVCAAALCGILCGSPVLSTVAFADDNTVKVGVLHSLSGTMAISETSLRDMLLFAFDQINKSGGVLGKQIEPAPLRGKGQATPRAGPLRGRLWLLDLGQPQVCPSRLREG